MVTHTCTMFAWTCLRALHALLWLPHHLPKPYSTLTWYDKYWKQVNEASLFAFTFCCPKKSLWPCSRILSMALHKVSSSLAASMFLTTQNTNDRKPLASDYRKFLCLWSIPSYHGWIWEMKGVKAWQSMENDVKYGLMHMAASTWRNSMMVCLY